MKKNFRILLATLLLSTATMRVVADSSSIQQTAIDSEAVWGPGTGAQEGSFTAVSLSMLGWGIGLAIVIAVLSAVLSETN